MKKKTVLFIQGGGEGAYEADKKLAASLQTNLGEDFMVVFPKIPNENDPDYDRYKDKIDTELESVKEKLVLVGHSLGGCFLLKYLSEKKVSNHILGIFLISTPFWGKGGWQFEGFSINNELASKSVAKIPIFFYHGTHDQTVPFAHLSLYAKNFPHAVIRELPGRGHQLDNDLSEVAGDIKSRTDI